MHPRADDFLLEIQRPLPFVGANDITSFKCAIGFNERKRGGPCSLAIPTQPPRVMDEPPTATPATSNPPVLSAC